MLFKLNNIDFTNCVVMDSWQVNSEDVTLNYTDANGGNHRQLLREQIKGSFSMYFKNEDLQTSFLNAFRSAKVGTYFIASVWVNNSDELVTSKFYITISPVQTIVGVRKTFKEFIVNIEEK